MFYLAKITWETLKKPALRLLALLLLFFYDALEAFKCANKTGKDVKHDGAVQ